MSWNFSEFEGLVASIEHLMNAVPESVSMEKPSAQAWSVKEITGHLIDLAGNNHQRFIRLQLTSSLDFPAYEAESWLTLGDYQHRSWDDLKQLWACQNRIILGIIRRIPESALGNTWNSPEGPVTLHQLVKDYYTHMARHKTRLQERMSQLGIEIPGGGLL